MKTKLLAIASAAALGIGAITGCSTTTTAPGGNNTVAKRESIDANVDSALARLYAQDPSSRELVAKARGVLVFPSIVSAGLVVGGSYGQGALRVHGRTTEYYSTAAGSVGLLAGAESKAMYLLFMTDEVARQVPRQQGLDGRCRCLGDDDQRRCQRAGRHQDGAAGDHRLRAHQRRPDGQRRASRARRSRRS